MLGTWRLCGPCAHGRLGGAADEPARAAPVAATNAPLPASIAPRRASAHVAALMPCSPCAAGGSLHGCACAASPVRSPDSARAPRQRPRGAPARRGAVMEPRPLKHSSALGPGVAGPTVNLPYTGGASARPQQAVAQLPLCGAAPFALDHHDVAPNKHTQCAPSRSRVPTRRSLPSASTSRGRASMDALRGCAWAYQSNAGRPELTAAVVPQVPVRHRHVRACHLVQRRRAHGVRHAGCALHAALHSSATIRRDQDDQQT